MSEQRIPPDRIVGDFSYYLLPLAEALDRYREALQIRPREAATAAASTVENDFVRELLIDTLEESFRVRKEKRVAASRSFIADVLIRMAWDCEVTLTQQAPATCTAPEPIGEARPIYGIHAMPKGYVWQYPGEKAPTG